MRARTVLFYARSGCRSFQFIHIDEPVELGFLGVDFTVEEQFIHKLLSTAAVVRQDVFEGFEFAHVGAHLELAPADPAADLAAAEQATVRLDAFSLAVLLDFFLKDAEELACLWGELIEAAAEDFVGEFVGRGDILAGHFDVL